MALTPPHSSDSSKKFRNPASGPPGTPRGKHDSRAEGKCECGGCITGLKITGQSKIGSKK
jgi:hypothetical protein